MLNEKLWRERIDLVDYAFQPIVNIHTGRCYGYEMLLRDYEKADFNSIDDFFDTAYRESVLYRVDLMLREKAIRKFKTVENWKKMKLFYNIDNRVLEMPDYCIGNTSKILEKEDVLPETICFEISEKHKFNSFVDIKNILNIYKQQSYNIVVDDFGTGFSGLQLLYYTEPDLVKIDRFFIENIEKDNKKKLFISNIINLAHISGIKVVAEGVETKEEFFVCKDVGCDLIQGYYIQKPTVHVDELREVYHEIARTGKETTDDKLMIHENLEEIYAIPIRTDMNDVFDLFKKNKERIFFPVVNSKYEPVGVIKEEKIKFYVYSPFGREVLLNKMKGQNLAQLISKCPTAEINMKIEKILELFSVNENPEGILIVENNKYKGFLSAKSLLSIINQKNLTIARDQNPLTKLPGNYMIKKYIAKSLVDEVSEYMLIYFDFDKFKPFNDKYGFNQGDRAIILFSNILKESLLTEKVFLGHIGGDDFFLGVSVFRDEVERIYSRIEYIQEKFSEKAKDLYSEEDRKRGYIEAKDRDGEYSKFDLLTVSSSGVFVPKNKKKYNLEEIVKIIFKQKKESKDSTKKIVLSSLLEK